MSSPEGPKVDPNATQSITGIPSQAAYEHAQVLIEGGFRETDMQFNIGRLEGGFRHGYDLVNPETKERVYVTSGSNPDSEQIVSSVLGLHAVLVPGETGEGYSSYEVPRGSRLLLKTLLAAPYKPDYMATLMGRTRELVTDVMALDPDAFGLTLSKIALTHNGDDQEDDMFFTLVPPLTAPLDKKIANVGLAEFIAEKKKGLTVKAVGRTVVERELINTTLRDLQEALNQLPTRAKLFHRPMAPDSTTWNVGYRDASR